MAKLFLSYQHDDERLARGLELRLIAQGHFFEYKVSTKIAGNWRAKLMKALADSDAVIFLLSERGLESKYVLGQIGAARAYASIKTQLMLPVMVGEVESPPMIRDIDSFKLAADHDRALDNLAAELNQVIADHAQKVPPAPRIFVSHRHKDEPLAAALVSVIEAAFPIEKSDIRCTSVQPYALQPGERVSERLRTDINGAELVIGLIGPETDESRYVLFELGASWGRGVPTFPVLVRGATTADIPGPLGERHSIALRDEASCLQLMDDIAVETSLQRRSGVAGRVAEQAKKLAEQAGAERKSRTQLSTKSKTAVVPTRPDLDFARMAQHIENYLAANNFEMVSFERVRANVNEAYTDAAMLEMIDKSPNKFRRAKLKGGRPGIALVP